MAEEREVIIDRIGLQGDGLADGPDGHVVAPFALPGERVQIGASGAFARVGEPSSDRQEAACPHFTHCGGCVAQHIAPAAYGAWKRDIVVGAFRQIGLTPDVAPLVAIEPGTRRRAMLTARRVKGQVQLGYHARRSDELINLEACPVLAPPIMTGFPGLRALSDILARGGEIRLTVLATAGGLDIEIGDLPGEVLDPPTRTKIAEIAAIHQFARVNAGGEAIVSRGKPVLTISGVDVAVPPGAFMQAVAEAEVAMAEIVVAATKRAKVVADLFCGVGTFSFALSRRARVFAADSDRSSVAALATAARGAQGLKPIEAKVRDLFREPLGWQELRAYDAVVFDPPRAGAKAQAAELAKSNVPTIVAISCNPATLARDAQILNAGGYKIGRVTPIDQFLWSHHVETVAVFQR